MLKFHSKKQSARHPRRKLRQHTGVPERREFYRNRSGPMKPAAFEKVAASLHDFAAQVPPKGALSREIPDFRWSSWLMQRATIHRRNTGLSAIRSASSKSTVKTQVSPLPDATTEHQRPSEPRGGIRRPEWTSARMGAEGSDSATPRDDQRLPPAPKSAQTYSGWGGIRTPGGLAPSAVFKTAALVHSATHPDHLWNLLDTPGGCQTESVDDGWRS